MALNRGFLYYVMNTNDLPIPPIDREPLLNWRTSNEREFASSYQMEWQKFTFPFEKKNRKMENLFASSCLNVDNFTDIPILWENSFEKFMNSNVYKNKCER